MNVSVDDPNMRRVLSAKIRQAMIGRERPTFSVNRSAVHILPDVPITKRTETLKPKTLDSVATSEANTTASLETASLGDRMSAGIDPPESHRNEHGDAASTPSFIPSITLERVTDTHAPSVARTIPVDKARLHIPQVLSPGDIETERPKSSPLSFDSAATGSCVSDQVVPPSLERTRTSHLERRDAFNDHVNGTPNALAMQMGSKGASLSVIGSHGRDSRPLKRSKLSHALTMEDLSCSQAERRSLSPHQTPGPSSQTLPPPKRPSFPPLPKSSIDGIDASLDCLNIQEPVLSPTSLRKRQREATEDITPPTTELPTPKDGLPESRPSSSFAENGTYDGRCASPEHLDRNVDTAEPGLHQSHSTYTSPERSSLVAEFHGVQFEQHVDSMTPRPLAQVPKFKTFGIAAKSVEPLSWVPVQGPPLKQIIPADDESAASHQSHSSTAKEHPSSPPDLPTELLISRLSVQGGSIPDTPVLSQQQLSAMPIREKRKRESSLPRPSFLDNPQRTTSQTDTIRPKIEPFGKRESSSPRIASGSTRHLEELASMLGIDDYKPPEKRPKLELLENPPRSRLLVPKNPPEIIVIDDSSEEEESTPPTPRVPRSINNAEASSSKPHITDASSH